MVNAFKILLLVVGTVLAVSIVKAGFIDDFNKADSPNLGTAANGNNWGETNEHSGCNTSIESNRAFFQQSGGIGCYAELNLTHLLTTNNDKIGLHWSFTEIQTIE